MSSAAVTPDREAPAAEVPAASVAATWAVWCVLAASTSVALGVHWDISWHRSIGRDTFWSPPHMLIYFAAVLAGTAAAALIVRTTFGGDAAARERSVGVLGFRGPLGAFVCAWGGTAMLISAPFDDWWHGAYGLDVKILSPPHVLLAVGIIAIHIGALLFVLAQRNGATGARRRRLDALYLHVGAMILVALMTLVMERTVRVRMHEGAFYRVLALAAPGVLAAVGAAAERRWAATTIAAIYSLFLWLLILVLPLFPSEPKLGPVLYPVTHFVPPEFPVLLVIPALALDLLRPRLDRRRRVARAGLAGLVFSATFIPAQWLFAWFLMSPLARNRIFGAGYFDFRMPADGYYRRFVFLPPTGGVARLALGLAVSVLLAALTSWLGLACGQWMRKVRR